MTSQTGAAAGGAAGDPVTWLIQSALGPAAVALPVNLVADELRKLAVAWFKRVRQTDDLSRLAKAATGEAVELSRAEVKALRKLLEKEDTWHSLAVGNELNVAKMTGQIAACLSPRDGRSAEASQVAAGAIARGLLEFAVYDLAPQVFQKVVQVRLQQMVSQVTALNEALFDLHKDLYHDVKETGGQFQILMNRLPPEPADVNEIRIYLRTLIGWLNTDPWPTFQRQRGPVLTPAAIESTLRVSAKDLGQDHEVDADDLARQCTRLVILGDPGSGKTWLAKRTARICAEQALTELADGVALGDVELPLYTTCARFIAATGGIRQATTSAAIERIGDLGGSRIITSLRLRFEAPDTRTLLVIDSLDEAADPGEARDRLREADTLPQETWRIVLTSRRSSWDGQLAIEKQDPAHQVGELQPLRYPGDVDAVIDRWFTGQPERGRVLAAQIAGRPSLQRDATVPLILAFYCILGGGQPSPESLQPLPDFKYDLYERVIKRMLYGLWRRPSGPAPDMDVCLAALRTWAWQGARSYPISGIGKWDDDIPTTKVELSHAGQAAVDHIAAPQGGPDFDTGQTTRRFVHRSIQEHLVAKHVASLPADEAVQELLPHLWYDPAWEYAAPTAIARHPERSKVLGSLICQAAGSDHIPDGLSVIDVGGEVRKLLARIATESKEGDWSDAMKRMIGEARVELARRGVVDDLGQAIHWPTWNPRVCQALLDKLAQGGVDCPTLAGGLARLEPNDSEMHQAREALLGKLASADGETVARLAAAFARLSPTDDEKGQACHAVLEKLASASQDTGGYLLEALIHLDPDEDSKQRVRQVVLDTLTHGELWCGDLVRQQPFAN